MVNRKINCTQRTIMGVIAALLSILTGCGQFFSEKPTVIQTNEIFRELSQVKVVADANRPYPYHYTPEPVIIQSADALTIFYFARQMPPATLVSLLKEQMGVQASKNDATNQIVMKSKTEDEASAILTFLNEVDVAPIQVRVDCIISEVYADVTLDYETSTMIYDLCGEDITIESFFPGASTRAPDRPMMGLKTGITRDDFEAIIDVLESRGYAKILMRPSVEVINGTKARIETDEEVPIPEQILSGGDIITTIQYKQVIDYLEVIPQVYSDGTIGLKTKAGISSRTVPEGVTQAPIITKRTIENEENRLRKGQSLVVGGIIKTERVSVVRGTPFLRDIPLLGILFSSKDFEDRAKEILFVLTPSVSSMGVDHSRVVESIRQKHARPEYKRGIEEFLTDPLGITAYTEQVEMQAAEAQFERLRAEIQRTEALVEVDEVKARLLDTVEEVAAERAKAEKLQAEAQKAREQAETSKAEAEKTRTEAEKTITDAEKTRQEAEKMMAEAKKLQSEAKKAQTETEKARAEAEKAKAEAEKAKAEAERAKAETLKAKQKAVKKAEETPKTEAAPQEPQTQSPAPKTETEKPAAPSAESSDAEQNSLSENTETSEDAPPTNAPQADAEKTKAQPPKLEKQAENQPEQTPETETQKPAQTKTDQVPQESETQSKPQETEPHEAADPSETQSDVEENNISENTESPDDAPPANAPEADAAQTEEPPPTETPTSPDENTTGAEGETESNTQS